MVSFRRVISAFGLVLVAGSCGPEGNTSPLPIGGYQLFAGAMSDGEVFKGRAWLDSRTGKRQLCAEVGKTLCRATYSTSAALGQHYFPFTCTDGRAGSAKASRKIVEGKAYSYFAHIKMKDGSSGAASLGPPQLWYGEELCIGFD